MQGVIALRTLKKRLKYDAPGGVGRGQGSILYGEVSLAHSNPVTASLAGEDLAALVGLHWAPLAAVTRSESLNG